ncbi:hypothetical protein C3L33_12931, partial [Rhododendron williamsianum]
MDMENDEGFVHELDILQPAIQQGSCSAVATAQCLSATLQMMLGGLQDPARRASVQELIDKTQEAFPNDCYRAVPGEGGFRGFPSKTAFLYIKQYGVAVEAKHPYLGQRTSTPTPLDSPRIRIQGYTVMKRLPGTDPLYLETQPIIRRQPIVGVFLAPDSLEQHREKGHDGGDAGGREEFSSEGGGEFGGEKNRISVGQSFRHEERAGEKPNGNKKLVLGVYQGAKDVDDAKTAGRHAVVIFGYGTENGQDYYWIQNTWGPEWGDNGIGKVSAHLFIYFVYPDLEGISIEEPGEGSA